MIIGDSDQCISIDKNCYDSPTAIILKRKLSSEVVVGGENSYVNQVSNDKMHYMSPSTADGHYQNCYQTKVEEIHQDGHSSYINLTVLTPTSTNQVTGQSTNHEIQYTNHHTIQQSSDEIKTPTSTATTTKSVGSVRNYQNQQTDNFEDNEDKNLSWLFNFKIDEIANLSPEIKRKRSNNNNNNNNNNSNNHQHHQQTSIIQQNFSTQQHQQQQQIYDEPKSKDPCIEDDLNVAENVVIDAPSYSAPTPKKPPFTYTELIEYALEDKGELTVSGIYQWISDRFPYYKSNDDRWKNSVRHNLSINPHFRKGNKAKAGAGHLWKISSRESEANFLAWEHKKQRLELFFKMEAASQQKHQEANRKEALESINIKNFDSTYSPSSYDAELNAATASIITSPVETSPTIIATHGDRISPVNSQQYYQYHEVVPISHMPTEDLRRTAGEILSGVRRNVEVQIMHPNELQSYSILNTEDYLNPISKEDIMEESGLARRYDEFYLIDSSGVNMTANGGEEESTEVFEIFHDDFNLNYFGNNNIIA